jgi:hypothetical protein
MFDKFDLVVPEFVDRFLLSLKMGLLIKNGTL